MIRSFLFVPADSERKLQKASGVNADALILDLEDAVAAEARPAARELAREFLSESDNAWVRINPMDSDDALLDLEGVMAGAPAGIILPKPRSAADGLRLAEALERLEKQHDLDSGSTPFIALCTEHPQALFNLDSWVGATERLAGLSWGAEDLSAAVGATTNRDANGNWLPTYEMARSLCLIAAAAAEVVAIDTVFTDFRNLDGLQQYASNARRDGFSGMLAIHPDQVDIINDAFMPSADEIDSARRIVELFDANPGAGTLGLDGKMIDRPHFLQAQRVLALAEKLNNKN
ncbi:MAG: CoA ester lyase [Pseudomonadota bacterium]